MLFSYNWNNRLSEISNSLGERVAFKYDASGYLTTVERENLPTLTLSYSTSAGIKRISKIATPNHTSTDFSYNTSGMLTAVTKNSDIIGIAHDNVVEGANAAISTFGVKYTFAETTLTYDGIKQEIYKFDTETNQTTAYYELINGLVSSAEHYTYYKYLPDKTKRAGKSCLNRYSYADFASHMQIETVEDVTYNSFKEPMKVVSSKYDTSCANTDCLLEQTVTEYSYNSNHKLIEKKTTHSYYGCCDFFDATVAIVKYYYSTAGELVRKESYVEGEELKTGITVEEHVFNDKGVEIKSFTYNSLDPSSKLYTEYEVDEGGRILAAFDESGEHKTSFDYATGNIYFVVDDPYARDVHSAF